VPNTPENLARWIQNPPALKEGAAMPPMQNLNEQQARDVAAFLYSWPFNPQ
jgi:cytochrome c1